jgi:hypothetical protein
LIDVARLGCGEFDRRVYAMHESGMTVRMIARAIGVDADMVRDTITDIWRLDDAIFRQAKAGMRGAVWNDDDWL